MPSINGNAKLSELQAVNVLLQVIGQAPVSSLTGEVGTDVSIACNTLSHASREVQMQGWSFNRDYNVELSPNTSGNIPVATNVLMIDGYDHTDPEVDVVIRTNKLWDRYNNTFTFTNAIKAEVTYLISWDDLPAHAQWFIVNSAALTMGDNLEGSNELHRFGLQSKTQAWFTFRKAEGLTEDANLLRGHRSAGLRKQRW